MLLAAEAASLEGAGAELLVLCTNTMHKVATAVASATCTNGIAMASAIAVRCSS